jgi:hypothetical protein
MRRSVAAVGGAIRLSTVTGLAGKKPLSTDLLASHGVSLAIPRCPTHNDSSVAMAPGTAAPD